MDNRLDIVIFGATGFTGKYIIKQMCKLQTNGTNVLTWGIAGRSDEKLKNLLVEIISKTDSNIKIHVPIIITDATNEETVRNMTGRARLVVNCCGPFQLYGEVVVKCCLETRTHLIDISAEPLFIETIEAKYFNEAREKGIYIVSACGLASLPSDLGVIFMEQHFEGTLHSVEVFLHATEDGGVSLAPKGNYGTWESFIEILENGWELLKLRRNSIRKPLVTKEPKLRMRCPFTTFNLSGNTKWLIPLPIIDIDVLKRTQRYFSEHEGKQPLHVQCYLALDSFLALLQAVFLVIMCIILSQFKYGRSVLLKYPEFFSNNFFSHAAPTEDELNRVHFCYTLCGRGWSKQLLESANCSTVLPDKEITVEVSGINPGYGLTAIATVLSAVTILTETKKLPSKGAVYTTAAAFSKTSLIKQLHANGIKFKVITIKDL